ncbi:hypothetical protein U1Q18_036580 [Sarracenia purpurea var. burkii]
MFPTGGFWFSGESESLSADPAAVLVNGTMCKAARRDVPGEGGGVSRCSWSRGEGTERGEEAAGSSVVTAAAGASSTGPSSTGTSMSSTAAGFST